MGHPVVLMYISYKQPNYIVKHIQSINIHLLQLMNVKLPSKIKTR
jgi:hypothetical protein